MIDEKQSRQDLGLACAVIHSRFIRKKKCFIQIHRALYEDAKQKELLRELESLIDPLF